jgi:hypothetical protein
MLSLLNKYSTDNGFVIYDYKNRLYNDNKKKYIPQLFNNNIIFISAQSFQQTHKILSKNIRKFVLSEINKSNTNNITCIGGESYIYGILSNYENIFHYTNCLYIYNDLEYNNTIYRKNIENNVINYNSFNNYFSNNNICVINLSKLYLRLLENINNKRFTKIIIINCNHNDFWNKIKILKNYKLVKREQFICEKLKYFITVNIFIYKC